MFKTLEKLWNDVEPKYSSAVHWQWYLDPDTSQRIKC